MTTRESWSKWFCYFVDEVFILNKIVCISYFVYCWNAIDILFATTMLVSCRRVAVVTYAVIVFIGLTAYGVLWRKHGALPISFLNAFGSSDLHSNSPDATLPSTTEQKVSRFAYAQYATNLDYLCNTVSIPCSRIQTQRQKLKLVS